MKTQTKICVQFAQIILFLMDLGDVSTAVHMHVVCLVPTHLFPTPHCPVQNVFPVCCISFLDISFTKMRILLRELFLYLSGI